jgi:hypothetical protein
MLNAAEKKKIFSLGTSLHKVSTATTTDGKEPLRALLEEVIVRVDIDRLHA